MDKLEKLNNLLNKIKKDVVTPKDIELFIVSFLAEIKKAKTDVALITEEKLKLIDVAISELESKHSEFFKKIDNDINSKETSLIDSFGNEVNSITENFTSDLDVLKNDFLSNFTEAKDLIKELRAIKVSDGYTPIKGVDYFDGINPNPEDVVPFVLEQLPKVEETTGEQIIDLINDLPLEDENKIDASHIKNLPKGDTFYGGSGIKEIIAGTNITVTNTNLGYPVISSTGGGSSTFIGLTDVPATYTGQTLKAVRVNAGETALEFYTVGAGAGDMVLASVQTNSGAKTFLDTTFKLQNVANTFNGSFVNTNTANRIYTLKDSAGTLAFVSDITGINSGTNTGDQTIIVGITGTKAQFDTAVTDGNFLYVGDVTQYTDELAQDAVGAMVDGTLVYTDLTPLLSRAALTGAITASAGSNATLLGSFTLAQLNTAISDADVATGGGTATGTNTGDQTITLTGNVTGSGTGSFAATIANDAVTYAKMQNVSAISKLLGRGSAAGAGDPEEITLGTNLSMSGTTLNAAGGAGTFAVTETEIDFGSTPVTEKTFTVTDALITGSSKIMCTESGNVATDRVGADSLWDSIVYSALGAAGSFTLYARASGAIIGKRKMFYTYS